VKKVTWIGFRADSENRIVFKNELWKNGVGKKSIGAREIKKEINEINQQNFSNQVRIEKSEMW
jgi:hypothetical protein